MSETTPALIAQLFQPATTSPIPFGRNSRITACLYAPFGDISASGSGTNGMLTGCFVADKITASSKMAFHFDEALQNSGGGWKQTGWLELQSAADRATVAGRTGDYLR